MKKFYAIAGIIAGVLIILGGVFTGVGIVAGADKSFDIFDNVGINIGLPEAKNMEYTKLKDFNSIDVSANLAGIEIVKSDKNRKKKSAATLHKRDKTRSHAVSGI